MPDAASNAISGPSPRRWLARLRSELLRLSQRGLLLRAATLATLALPVALMYGRTLGEILIGLVAIGFLVESWSRRRWDWLTDGWAACGLLLWAWILLCSLRDGSSHAIGEAVAVFRFMLFVVALQQWVLRSRATRRLLGYVAIALALWIIVESWQQYLLGSNIFGVPRWGNGSLTGPFDRARAGGTLQVLFLPGMLPIILLLLLDGRPIRRIGGAVLLLLVLITSFLISQDMPAILLLFGLCISGLVIRQFRLPLLLSLAGGAVFLAVGVMVSPTMYHRLVVRFSDLIVHFPVSPYGLLLSRALAMIQAHPWLGLGFDGFRAHCMDPQYLHGSSWLPPPDPTYGLRAGWLMRNNAADLAGCSIHPHNYWLQIGTNSGVPGLLLFAVLAVITLSRAGRGMLWRRNPYQVALFAAAAVVFWPIDSTTSLFTIPNAGWMFLTMGWAMAEGDAAGDTIAASPIPTAGATQGAGPAVHPMPVGSTAPTQDGTGGA